MNTDHLDNCNRHRYQIDSDRDRLDFDRIHAWLSSTYWSPGVERDRVERAAAYSSLVIGAYLQTDESIATGEQVGYMRVISDRATFAYICDVYVDEVHRGQGIATAMLRFALADPEHQNLRRWLLVTRDAHAVYASVGFQTLPTPERWMALLPNS